MATVLEYQLACIFSSNDGKLLSQWAEAAHLLLQVVSTTQVICYTLAWAHWGRSPCHSPYTTLFCPSESDFNILISVEFLVIQRTWICFNPEDSLDKPLQTSFWDPLGCQSLAVLWFLFGPSLLTCCQAFNSLVGL